MKTFDIKSEKDVLNYTLDGKPVVILSLELAESIWDSLVDLVSFAESYDGKYSDLRMNGQNMIDQLTPLIRQSQGYVPKSSNSVMTGKIVLPKE